MKQNFKFQIPACRQARSNFKRSEGFTLVELLISTGIIVVIGSIIVAILVSSLRGSNKATTIGTVKDNGTYAMTQITKLLHTAVSIDKLDSATADCVVSTGNPTPTPILHQSITFTALDGGKVTLACSLNGSSTIASNSADLIDKSQVSVTSCSFTCTQYSSSDIPLVEISFMLDRVGSSTFTENKVGPTPGGILFHTSVALRNLVQ